MGSEDPFQILESLVASFSWNRFAMIFDGKEENVGLERLRNFQLC